LRRDQIIQTFSVIDKTAIMYDYEQKYRLYIHQHSMATLQIYTDINIQYTYIESTKNQIRIDRQARKDRKID
jgi:hypothetical protein